MKISPLILVGMAFIFTGCTEMQIATHTFKKATNPAPYSAPPITAKRKIGNPYVISGKTYYPISSSEGYKAKGIASWYGKDFHNKKTANGETYNMFAMTAAHPTLPLPTYVRVTNLENGLSIMVKVNDRGPFKRGRLIDLSYKAANLLGMAKQGTAPVLVEALPSNGGSLNRNARTKYLAKNKSPQLKSSFTNRVARKTRVNNNEEYQVPTKRKNAGVDIYVQTGAFGNIGNAIKQQSKLSKMFLNNYPIQLTKTSQNGSTLNRVRVGPIKTINDADELLLKVIQAGFNTAIIAVN